MNIDILVGAAIAIVSVYLTHTFGAASSIASERRERYWSTYRDLLAAVLEIDGVANRIRRDIRRGTWDNISEDEADNLMLRATDANLNSQGIIAQLHLDGNFFSMMVHVHYLSYWTGFLRYVIAASRDELDEVELTETWDRLQEELIEVKRLMRLHLRELDQPPFLPARLNRRSPRRLALQEARHRRLGSATGEDSPDELLAQIRRRFTGRKTRGASRQQRQRLSD